MIVITSLCKSQKRSPRKSGLLIADPSTLQPFEVSMLMGALTLATTAFRVDDKGQYAFVNENAIAEREFAVTERESAVAEREASGRVACHCWSQGPLTTVLTEQSST